MITKVCTKCNQEKSASEFYRDRRNKDGCSSHCRVCNNTYHKSHDYITKNRNGHLKRKFGWSLEDYDAMLEQQEECCAICQVHIDDASLGRGKHFSVDHNHLTGEVRGLLCNECNTLLGKAGDSPDILIKAASYLLERGSYAKPTS